MDLVTAATIVASTIAFVAFLHKLGGGVSTREFDAFKEEVRHSFALVRDDIKRYMCHDD